MRDGLIVLELRVCEEALQVGEARENLAQDVLGGVDDLVLTLELRARKEAPPVGQGALLVPGLGLDVLLELLACKEALLVGQWADHVPDCGLDVLLVPLARKEALLGGRDALIVPDPSHDVLLSPVPARKRCWSGKVSSPSRKLAVATSSDRVPGRRRANSGASPATTTFTLSVCSATGGCAASSASSDAP